MKSVGSKTGLVLAGIVFVGLAGVSAKAASFQGLGDLPGGSFSSSAYGVSADGLVVVGWSVSASGYEAFRWEGGEMVGLGDLPGGDFESYAWGVSADGSVVVGRGYSASGTEAFRWTDLNSNGLVDPDEKLDYHPEFGLGDLPGGGSFSSYAYDVSADGSVVVGYSSSASSSPYYEAFRWTDLNGNGLVEPSEKLDYHPEFGLGYLPGDDGSGAFGVSADGSVVVGISGVTSGPEAFRWTAGAGMVGLGDLPGGDFYSFAYDVSADGSVVVGGGHSASGWEAFRWIDLNGNGLVDPNEKLDYNPQFGLGDLPGGSFYSDAWDVSGDGSVVVGRSDSVSGTEAFIWDAVNGMRSLKDVLEMDFGLDLTGWILTSARGISDDGSTIVGFGNNPSGDIEAWIATLTCDYKLAGDMNDDCRVDFLDVALMAGNWLIDCNVTPAEAACISK